MSQLLSSTGLRCLASLGTAAFLVCSCSSAVDSLGRSYPVVSLILLAGESLQVATVLLSAAADSAIPSALRPVPASTVLLRVATDEGTAAPLVGYGENGRYAVRISVQPGHTYRLLGTIAGTPISAETTVPSEFNVSSPARDTVTPADGTGFPPLIHVPYVFSSRGALGYEVRVVTLDGVVEQVAFLREPVGQMPLVLRDSGVRRLVFLGYDGNASAWLGSSTPRSSVAGAFGAFGSALAVRGKFVSP